MHLTCVVGARPNFMKVAPILEAARRQPGIETRLIHTGQHYDHKMSALFFEELGLPAPDVDLGVGSASHAAQTARVMIAFDEALDRVATDVVVVVGDINSTLACALVAVKRGTRVAHVEAGLRSGDRTMPEEINRLLTDQISDYLFTTEPSAADHLRREGIAPEKIHFVGNVMIDTLLRNRDRAARSDVVARLQLVPKEYAVATLHRPSNVDTRSSAENTLAALETLARRLRVVFPLHPRSAASLETLGLLGRLRQHPSIVLCEPLGYLDFLALMNSAAVVFTDSGGIQEETTVLGVPCITFRENTERPVTITEGTNHLVGLDPCRVEATIEEIITNGRAPVRRPLLWDGHAAERIVAILSRSSAAHTHDPS